ncbi:hypothetical protein [Cyanothece sp. BG0011]|uniref:hypothetical protein n=1 Tax=Cyanothece sp. BG0011 TaxID=2082950 RepID=UPI000D1F39AA|nr:hypothetical protein [Cyanothece sp. BG0011]
MNIFNRMWKYITKFGQKTRYKKKNNINQHTHWIELEDVINSIQGSVRIANTKIETKLSEQETVTYNYIIKEFKIELPVELKISPITRKTQVRFLSGIEKFINSNNDKKITKIQFSLGITPSFINKK